MKRNLHIINVNCAVYYSQHVISLSVSVLLVSFHYTKVVVFAERWMAGNIVSNLNDALRLLADRDYLVMNKSTSVQRCLNF